MIWVKGPTEQTLRGSESSDRELTVTLNTSEWPPEKDRGGSNEWNYWNEVKGFVQNRGLCSVMFNKSCDLSLLSFSLSLALSLPLLLLSILPTSWKWLWSTMPIQSLQEYRFLLFYTDELPEREWGGGRRRMVVVVVMVVVVGFAIET